MTEHHRKPPTPQDLSAPELCAREPIHIPGAIQPHGALVCVAPDDLRVLHLSANAEAILGHKLPLMAPITPSLASVIASWTASDQLSLQRHIVRDTNRFHIVGSRSDQGLLLEFEPLSSSDEPSDDHAYEDLRHFMSRIEPLSDVQAVGAVVAQQIRAMTGFNRTLLYRFDADGHGTVVAEDGDGVLPSYLGLRFPASDIPSQARALYLQNRLRLIPDADYEAVPVTPSTSPLDGKPLDLTPVSLRSVSPVHLRYMRNMATCASMSISLIINGRLWGLVSCHHGTPRWVSPRVRSACEFLGQLVAQQIQARERTAEIAEHITLKRIESGLLVELAHTETFQAGLAANPDTWLALTDATGAAVVFANQMQVAGSTPSAEQIRELAAWLHAVPDQPVFATDLLSSIYPAAAGFAIVASGLIAISISQLHPSYIMWFRPELIHTVTWAGDPRKPTDPGTLSPRTSFDQWKELVRNKAAAWKPSHIEAAIDFRSSIINFVLRRAEERAAMTERLQLSNKELEAFSYSISHDLRAPFRHIVGYTELLRDRETTLDTTSRRFLDTIRDAALSAGQLVDDLLAFSQLNRLSLSMTRVDMNKLIAEARMAVLQGVKDRQIAWHIGNLPEAWGDGTMIRQAVLNLLSNAVKYTGGRQNAEISLEGSVNEAETVYVVRDNGIGFDMRYVGKLFGVFQRLHRAEDFEGTGIGLALTKRIVDRHGGWIKAEAVENEGATFTFALPRGPSRPIPEISSG